MEEFFTRLRERKLVQWALAYVAAAFALVQVIDIVAQRFGWPDAVERFILIALAIGFFIALVLAWYHGERGEQKVSGTELLILALLLAMGGGALWHFAPMPREAPAVASAAALAIHATPSTAKTTPGDVEAATAISATAIPAKSVAVLPFENLSDDKGNAYFADGMQDLILTKLADIGDLKVISRTSTAKYTSHPDDLKIIAQQLGVATILEGSVQKAGNQVLINVQLIDAQSDNHLWAEAYPRTLDNIFGVEGEVAQKVAEALKAKLSPAETQAVAKVPTRSKAAYDAYLKAWYYLDDSNRTLDNSELERAVVLSKQAIQSDPDFVDAYSQLALAYVKLGDHADEAEAASRHALALDPNSANAHIELGLALANRGDFAGAIPQAQEAVRLRPADSQKHMGLGFVYLTAGRFGAAAAAFQRATELAPQSNFDREWLAVVQMTHRHYADARDTMQIPLARDPADLQAATSLAQTWVFGWGDLEGARKVLQAVPTPVAASGALSDAWYWQHLYERDYAAALDVIAKAPAAWFVNQHCPLGLYQAQVYQAQGDTAKAQAAFAAARTQLEAWIKITPDDPSLHAYLALALAGVGENDQALREAHRAVTLQPVAKDAFYGPRHLLALAEVHARADDVDAAVKLLDQLLAMPAGEYVSVPLLKLDPTWDPIRNDPRFQVLLKKYASEGAARDADSDKTAAHD